MMSLLYVIIIVILVILLISLVGFVSAIKDINRQSDRMRQKRNDIRRRKSELGSNDD